MDCVPHQEIMHLSMEIESPTENKVQIGSEVESPTEKNKVQVGSEIESPPQKKPKLDEDEDEDEDEDDYDDVYSSSSGTTYDNEMMGDDFVPIPPGICGNCDSDVDDEYRPDFTSNKVDDQIWDNYFQQIQESDGFDITDYPGACFATTVFPMPFYLNCPKNVDMLKDYCGKALKLYNAKYETNYEVKEILKVNGGGCRSFIFYTTFSVEAADGGEEIFQAKVVEDLDNTLEFPIIRPKGKKDLEMKSDGTSCGGCH